MKKMIYLDHAATTKPAPGVAQIVMQYMTEEYGNASAGYRLGIHAKKQIREAKRTIAESLHAEENEIYFTSGGTEADNWALVGAAEAMQEKGRHIITTAIEHHAVLRTCAYLEKRGFRVTYLPVDAYGTVAAEDIARAICPDTILVSVMAANNEVGTIQPIREIGEIVSRRGILFHTDAVQAYGHIPLDVRECHIDLLSASGHKIGGPKGIGFLYVSNDARIEALLHGGRQERGRRAGTENVPGIAGLAQAVQSNGTYCGEREEKVRSLREYLIERLMAQIPDCHLNGHRTQRLSGNVHVSFPGIEGESLLIQLDMKGICASGGSACTTGESEPSHVLTAMGLSPQESKGSLRLTLSADNTREELDETVEAVRQIVAKLREMTGYQIKEI